MNSFLQQDEVFSQELWQSVNFTLTKQISEDNELTIYFHQSIQIHDESQIHTGTSFGSSIPQEIEVPRKRKNVDYEKNICAYITKKVVSCFISSPYQHIVTKLCRKNQCSYNQIQDYYGEKIQQVFGITLLSTLITPQNQDEVAIKKVFRTFLKWFLREKYMIYLLRYGKMGDKQKYIEFKNKYLLYIQEQENSELTNQSNHK